MTGIVQMWKENLATFHKEEIDNLKTEYPKKNNLVINIGNSNKELFDFIIKDPLMAENALYSALMEGKYIQKWN
jgi:hypothetical protein